MAENGSKALAEKPLLGAKICCTSISQENRMQIAKWAEELGADHTLDLTSDVTHLLVGDTNSLKYQYVAREREDVKVLLPEFVQAIRELWMNDDPIDLHALEAKYRCPTLYSIRISITGFDDLNFRNELEKNIIQNGGDFCGDLTRDCTHLIAFMATGKKYDYACAWGLKIVSIKWYKDTLDRGMQLDESKYHPSMLPEVQGIGAWNRQPHRTVQLGKRLRNDQQTEQTSRKIRRTASAKFGSQHSDMWNDIVGQNDKDPASMDEVKLRVSKSLPNINQTSHGEMENRPVNEMPPPKKSMVNQGQQADDSTGIFSGKHFSTRGFDDRRKTIVLDTLSGHGATVYEKLKDLVQTAITNKESCFLIVPFQIEAHQLNMLERKCSNITIVTELWLEWCITSKCFVSPDQYLLGLPVTEIRLPAATQLAINATGFPQRQTLHISKVVKKLGAIYHEIFSQDTTLLLCCSTTPNRQKIEHAQAWRMPVVSEKWLWQLIRTSRIPPLEPFSLLPPKSKGTKTPIPGKGTNSVATNQRHASTHPPSRVCKEAEDETIRADVPNIRAQTVEGNDNSAMPLREMSSNLQPKQTPLQKKKLFQAFDGTCSAETTQPSQYEAQAERTRGRDERQAAEDTVTIVDDDTPETVVEPRAQPEMKSHSALLSEFFQMKAEATAKQTAAEAGRPSKSTGKKLIGRALSNLSNTSRISGDENSAAHRPLSRASSITSMNTDGLGVPLSAMSRIPSDTKGKELAQQTRVETSSKGKPNLGSTHTVASPEKFSDALPSKGMNTLDFHAALATLSNSQPQLPPDPTPEPQMSYADSEDAVRLKAKLAETRRRRAKLGQKEGYAEHELTREESEEKRQRLWREARESANKIDGVIRDDEAVIGVGPRTRGREKALSALLNDEGVIGEDLVGLF